MKAPLPTVRGIGPSYLRLPEGPWKNILEFLAERFPDVTPETWISRMQKREVVDDKGAPLSTSSHYQKGITIFYYREIDDEPPIPFEETILYRDNHILVADKPHFLPVVPSGQFLHETLLVRLKKKLNLDNLVPIHRIDRETAGVVLFSHNSATRGAYVSLFRTRSIKKIYEAHAANLAEKPFPIRYRSRMVPGEPFFRMKEVEGEPNSETHIDILEKTDNITIYRLQPVTGKKHQLRVHLAALGIPIVNDRLYPDIQPRKRNDFLLPLKLLARAISFQDPVTGEYRHFQSNRKMDIETL